MDLMEHLDELRSRILRSLLVAALAGVISWYFLYDPIYRALTMPLFKTFKAHGIQGSLVFLTFTEPFFLKLKVCAILSLCIASPWILWEVWGFIAPGLYPNERKPFKIVFPMAIALFIMGAGLSYVILPAAFAWFLSYLPHDVVLQQRLPDYLIFVVKMCGAFGLGFELPVVLMFAGKIGLIRAKTMRTYWRQAVVLIMLAAAIITPSNDPFSMLLMSTPMAILYLGSIALVKWVEPKEIPAGDDEEEERPKKESRYRQPVSVDEED
jgi:sec-independent protein translocase protein TatC